MSSPESSAARVVLEAARPAFARLTGPGGSDEAGARLADMWSAADGALRALAGAGAARGLDLIREARQRRILTFEQANALVALHALVARAQSAPPGGDLLAAAREVFAQLEGAFTRAPSPAAGTPEPALPPSGMRNSPLGGPTMVPPPGRSSRGWRIGMWALLVVLAVAGAGFYWYGGRRDRAVHRAIELYTSGQHDAAQAEFTRAVGIDQAYALPHVYLARIAREANDLPKAERELATALRAEPGNELALREMGAYLLTVGNYELARKFYVRALDARPDDRTAQGFLGCALIKLGRTDEGKRWITRAGDGSWSGCVPGRAAP